MGLTAITAVGKITLCLSESDIKKEKNFRKKCENYEKRS